MAIGEINIAHGYTSKSWCDFSFVSSAGGIEGGFLSSGYPKYIHHARRKPDDGSPTQLGCVDCFPAPTPGVARGKIGGGASKVGEL